MDSWILTAVTFVPLLGAVIAMAMPNDDELHKRWALAVSLVALGLGIAMLFDFNYDQAGQLQWVVDEPWIDVIGAGYTLCLLYTSPSPRDRQKSRMPSSA